MMVKDIIVEGLTSNDWRLFKDVVKRANGIQLYLMGYVVGVELRENSKKARQALEGGLIDD
jgi:hypothetical protein